MSSKKGSTSTPGNGKKQDSKKKSITPLKGEHNDTPSSDDLPSKLESRVLLIFQSKSSSSADVSPQKCLCPASLMRNLQLLPGNLVVIETPKPIQNNEDFLICRAWSNKRSIQSQAVADKLVLHKMWQSSFDDGIESKKVIVRPMLDKEIISAKSLILRILDERHHDLKQSIELRQLVRENLLHCIVSIGAKFSVSLRAKTITLEVHHAVSTDKQSEKNIPADVIKVFEFTDKTELVIVSNNEEALPYFGFEKIHEVQEDRKSTRLNADEVMKTLQESFVGYDGPARFALGMTCLGLGFLDDDDDQTKSTDKTESMPGLVPTDPNAVDLIPMENGIKKQRFVLPVGTIIFGPPGIGKSQLVRSIIAALKCNSVQIDSKVLLSPYQGDAESLLRSKFQEAKSISPCCIVIENMDMICPSRASNNVSDVQKRIVSCYLSLVDELHGISSRVFILGTTTKPLDIDSAVRRSGRIDREIELSVPSSADREKIMQFMCKRHGITVVEGQNTSIENGKLWIKSQALREAAQKAHGMVASDLLQVLKEACYIHSAARIAWPTPSQRTHTIAKVDDNMICNLLDDFSGIKISETESDKHLKPHLDSEISEETILTAVQRIPPSALREVVVEVPTVRWTDIGGMESVKDSLKQVVEWPILHPEWFASMGLPPLKGVLLYGPPGCSKTLMAKAVATESSMNFLAVRGPELLSKWLGESEKAVQSLFKKARAAAPSIVFFDEIDALAGVRGESSAGVSDRVLSQLLTELDGIQGRKQVIVIAATNRPDMLDPALIRPGRIDRKIYVPPPDDGSRESILRLELKKLPLTGFIDFQQLVNATRGFSGAEVVAVCNEAALHAIDRNADSLSQEDIILAASKIKPQITADMIQFYTSFANKNR